MSGQTSTLSYVTSADGTRIAFDRLGDGPPVILLSGGSTDRQSTAQLAGLLATDFTVYNVDRRGRGDSGDTLPYAVEREFEDVAAVADAAGGSAGLVGFSSGGALALFAAAALPDRIAKVAAYEPPFIADPDARPPADTVDQYEKYLAEGRRDLAVEYFMAKVVRLPAEFVESAKTQPFWEGQLKIAHTLPYDGRVMGDYSIPVDRVASISQPALIAAGGADFPFMRDTAQRLADAIPNGQARFIDGQGHNVDPAVLAPVLREFFAG
jgi:pimeloyl-ACP methyl ester carboxylesterase